MAGFFDVTGKSSIKCIFFAEFHTTAGPKITFQMPENYVSKDLFDAVSVYIIPKGELQNKVITVNALGNKILGYPVAINSRIYPRNSFIFNMCFVCDGSSRTAHYEAVIRKLSSYLVGLEVECNFLSKDATKTQIPQIMGKIMNELNNTGTCTIPINDSNTIYLRVVPASQDPPQVEDHHVPVFFNRSAFVTSHWDLTTQQILPFVDGFNHVAKIAAETDVEISLVKACIQNMVYYGVVALIPIFQVSIPIPHLSRDLTMPLYSNVYTVTPNIQQLAEDKSLQEECLKYVGRSGNLQNFRDVFTLYCGLAPGTTVRDLCTRFNPHTMHIDERKLIQFGIIKGYIRRLYKYPIRLTPTISSASKKNKMLSKYFNGLHNYDEICCKTGFRHHELEERVETDPNVVVCWK